MKLNLLNLEKIPIIEQLQIEEALLRSNDENWCLINHGSPPAIVLGVSTSPSSVISESVYRARPVPLIRRFSGGGTVYVDENTLFVTFIMNQTSFPDRVLQWTRDFYQPIFSPLPFHLRENDYTIAEKKFGGNAQYFRKERFLHHTSFLFDFADENMSYLLYPPKTPTYRAGRSHLDFLTKLAHYFPKKEAIIEKICTQLSHQYSIQPITYADVAKYLLLQHRKTTKVETLLTQNLL